MFACRSNAKRWPQDRVWITTDNLFRFHNNEFHELPCNWIPLNMRVRFNLNPSSLGHPPAPMNHVKIYKGWPPRDTPSELVQNFNEIRKPQLDWVIKPVPHDLMRRIRFWRIKSPEQDFEYLYWTISKILCWNLFTCKGTKIVDWVERSLVTNWI